MQLNSVHFQISTLEKYIFGTHGRKNIQSLLSGGHREANNLEIDTWVSQFFSHNWTTGRGRFY